MGQMIHLRRKLGPPDFERMNLPREFWTAKVQHVSEKTRPAVVRFLKQVDTFVPDGVGLFLHGETGVGKTGVAALVCKEARSAGFTVYFTSLWELRELIRSRISFDDETSLIRRCQDVDVLVLDGLHREDATEKTLGAREIEELVSFRARARRTTIITTSMPVRDMEKPFSGLLEASQGSMVHLTVEGPNLREQRSDTLRRAVFGD